MFTRLFRSPKSNTKCSRNTARLRCELLEDRSVPAVITIQVNTTDDTPYSGTLMTDAGVVIPVDANGNTSLQAAITYANAHPQNGAWNTNHYNIDLSPTGGQTITLGSALTLNTNFNFLANGGTVTISCAANANNQFNHFNVANGMESHFTNLELVNGNNGVSGGSISNNGTAYFLNCTFVDNMSDGSGGAIVTGEDASTTVQNCTFVGNTSGNAGGLFQQSREAR